jgi:hypothetical protein
VEFGLNLVFDAVDTVERFVVFRGFAFDAFLK